jgi:serine/threonine protein kinase HipA of HipAB toxin-antitoxin module
MAQVRTLCADPEVRGLRAGRHVPESGGAGLKFNTNDGLKLGLPADKQPVGVTRLDPPLEKLGWYGEVDCRIVDAVKLYAANQLEKTFSPSSARNRAFTRVHRSMSPRVARVGPGSPRSVIRQLREK